MKKRILFLPRWYPNETDIQLGTFIRQQALLMKDDFDISIIYVQADARAKEKFRIVESDSDGIHEIVVYYKSMTGPMRKMVNAKRYSQAQEVGFEKLRAPQDLFHVHVPFRPALLALVHHRKSNMPFVVTEHWSGHLTGQFASKNALDKGLYKKVLEKASGISTVSQLLREKLRENTGFDSEVIPNLIGYTQPTAVPDHLPGVQLLSVSDLDDATKNVTGLLRAFRQAVAVRPDLRLTLIGGGPDDARIREMASILELESHVEFKGRLAHDEVLQAMHRCHFYICNSNFETFGMTVAEALRCGKPVISTHCGGPEEFLHPGNSLLVQTKNEEVLKDAILTMAERYRSFDNQKLAQEIENKFGFATVREKWRTFYTKALASSVG